MQALLLFVNLVHTNKVHTNKYLIINMVAYQTCHSHITISIHIFYQLIFLFMKTEINAQNKLRGKNMISTETSLYKTYYIKGMDKCNIYYNRFM